MTAPPERSKDELIKDISIRVRGYARHLAVVPHGDPSVTRFGVYRLPEGLDTGQHPYVYASVDRPEFDETPFFSLGLSADGEESDDTFDTHIIHVHPEGQEDGLMFFDHPNMGPRTAGTLTNAMAQRILVMLDTFDSLIPNLRPEPRTKQMIDWLNSHNETWRK